MTSLRRSHEYLVIFFPLRADLTLQWSFIKRFLIIVLRVIYIISSALKCICIVVSPWMIKADIRYLLLWMSTILDIRSLVSYHRIKSILAERVCASSLIMSSRFLLWVGYSLAVNNVAPHKSAWLEYQWRNHSNNISRWR